MDDNKQIKIEYIPILEASKITGLSIQTIRKLGDKKQIKCFKTPSGHRRFNKQDLEKFCDPDSFNEKDSENTKINYIYTRVSSKKQLDDLSRQVEYIQKRKPEYSSYTTISDIASGINFKRKGLQTILDSCIQGVIGEVVIAHRDRLSCFGFDLVKIIIEKAGGTITILDDEKNKSSEQELAEDLLSIIHIMQMGKRSYEIKQSKSTENQNETDEPTEEDN
ncbi:MAG: IS607 family transposase [Pseudomonadota bacterium]